MFWPSPSFSAPPRCSSCSASTGSSWGAWRAASSRRIWSSGLCKGSILVSSESPATRQLSHRPRHERINWVPQDSTNYDPHIYIYYIYMCIYIYVYIHVYIYVYIYMWIQPAANQVHLFLSVWQLLSSLTKGTFPCSREKVCARACPWEGFRNQIGSGAPAVGVVTRGDSTVESRQQPWRLHLLRLVVRTATSLEIQKMLRSIAGGRIGSRTRFWLWTSFQRELLDHTYTPCSLVRRWNV